MGMLSRLLVVLSRSLFSVRRRLAEGSCRDDETSWDEMEEVVLRAPDTLLAALLRAARLGLRRSSDEPSALPRL